MANPANPLDKFVTYTCHYELHAAKSWDELKKVESADRNAVTQDRVGNETLLINTRKDAHQAIDNVRFRYLSPTVDPSGAMQPIEDITLEVIEPGGTFFIEKIENQATKYNVTNLMGGLIFGLKVFFVGRLADNTIDTVAFEKIIPMQLINFSAKFSHKGGEYFMTFYGSGTVLASSPLRMKNGLSKAIGFVNKNISFKANTVQEAIKLLEEKLNGNYENVYATELKNTANARPIKYKIELDPKITGSVSLTTRESFKIDEPSLFTFTPNIDITTMIRQILTASKEVNEMVASSNPSISKEFHPGVKIPIVIPLYDLQDSALNVTYKIKLYEGGSSNKIIFDYYFSGAGKNVDIMDFETVFPSMIAWMSATIASTDLNRDANHEVPRLDPEYHATNNVVKDVTSKRLNAIPVEQKPIPASSGDIAMLNTQNRSDFTGFVKTPAKNVPASKLAFESYGSINGALHPQLTFTIRGHYDILNNCITYPDAQSLGFGVDQGLWVKVNIFNKDGSPFFYTGYYRVLTVENIFSGGRFTQLLTVMMSDRESTDTRNENYGNEGRNNKFDPNNDVYKINYGNEGRRGR